MATIRESVYEAMKVNEEWVAQRPSSKLNEEEDAALKELMTSPTFRNLIKDGLVRDDIRSYLVQETIYPASVCSRLADKMCRLTEAGVLDLNAGIVLAEGMGTAAPEGQDCCPDAAAAAGIQSPGGAADKGATQNQPVQGDKSEIARSGYEGEPVPMLKEPGTGGKLENGLTQNEKKKKDEDDEKDVVEQIAKSWKVAEGMGDTVEDKLAGLQGANPAATPAAGPQPGAPVTEDCTDLPGEKVTPDAAGVQDLDDVEKVPPVTPLDAGPARPDILPERTLETLDGEGLTISERLALALTEDACKKYNIAEGSSDWVRVFKKAIERVRSYTK